MSIEALHNQEYEYLKQRQQALVEKETVKARLKYLKKYLLHVDGAIEDCRRWIDTLEDGGAGTPSDTEQGD